ncbi:hypothetical protein [Wenyingzhuangia sp. IMCC45574]
MKLQTSCPSCKKSIGIKSWAQTRPDLEMEKGEEFVLNCKYCATNQKIHVNEVVAEVNYIIIGIGILLGLIATIALWRYGYISTLSGLIPVLFSQQEQRAIKTFNSYTIRRK